MENQAFEDVSPIENGDCFQPAILVFGRVHTPPKHLMDSVLNFSKKNPLSSWSFFPLKMVGSTSFFGFSHENLGVKKPANGAFLADMLNFRNGFFGGGPSMFEG